MTWSAGAAATPPSRLSSRPPAVLTARLNRPSQPPAANRCRLLLCSLLRNASTVSPMPPALHLPAGPHRQFLATALEPLTPKTASVVFVYNKVSLENRMDQTPPCTPCPPPPPSPLLLRDSHSPPPPCQAPREMFVPGANAQLYQQATAILNHAPHLTGAGKRRTAAEAFHCLPHVDAEVGGRSGLPLPRNLARALLIVSSLASPGRQAPLPWPPLL